MTPHAPTNRNSREAASFNKTDAGNGSYGICRVIDASRSPSPDPGRSAKMKLRPPTDTLAGCVWLPRFVDKVRHHLASTLEPDFVRPFCHPLATDGAFLSHFSLEKDEIIEIVRASNGDDAAVERWFLSAVKSRTRRGWATAGALYFSSMIHPNFNINRAHDALCRPSVASA